MPDDVGEALARAIRCRTWDVLPFDYEKSVDLWYEKTGKPWWVPRFFWGSPNWIEIMDGAMRSKRFRLMYHPDWLAMYETERGKHDR